MTTPSNLPPLQHQIRVGTGLTSRHDLLQQSYKANLETRMATPTIHQLIEMNAYEMNRSVAEACGWKDITPTGTIFRYEGRNPSTGVLEHIPMYLSDLNAIRAAAMSQPLEVRKAMRYWLWQLEDQMTAHLASAETMTKALLLALAKWKEPRKEPSCTPRG